MIVVSGVAKRFEPIGRRAAAVQAVREVHFEARDGCITGLLGPNGAGKTTTLRMVAGLLVPDAGSIQVGGIDVRTEPLRAQALLGVLTDAKGLYPRLTARENIAYHARLHGLDARAADRRIDTLAALLEMQPLLTRRVEGFSQGERMKTALARALVHDPSHIILDEPTNGLDVLATRSLRRALLRLRDDEGKCIVFSSHVMSEVERLCDRVTIVALGATVVEGTVAGLLAASGQADFEACYVALAHGTGHAPSGPDASDPSAGSGMADRAESGRDVGGVLADSRAQRSEGAAP